MCCRSYWVWLRQLWRCVTTSPDQQVFLDKGGQHYLHWPTSRSWIFVFNNTGRKKLVGYQSSIWCLHLPKKGWLLGIISQIKTYTFQNCIYIWLICVYLSFNGDWNLYIVFQWLLSHPQFIGNELYVGGDSYSGKIVPLVVTHILQGYLLTNIFQTLIPRIYIYTYFNHAIMNILIDSICRNGGATEPKDASPSIKNKLCIVLLIY